MGELGGMSEFKGRKKRPLNGEGSVLNLYKHEVVHANFRSHPCTRMIDRIPAARTMARLFTLFSANDRKRSKNRMSSDYKLQATSPIH